MMYQIKRILKWALRKGGSLIPDKFQISFYYRLEMGKKLDLKNPKTMNEKLQWLKLYNRKEEYRDLVDKVKVKDIVASKIGDKYVAPLLGVWDSFDEIDFDKLPDQFVLKTNHSGGNTGVIIVPDKSKLNKADAKKKLERSLESDIFNVYREWPYKGMNKKIFAEAYLGSDLVDYKFYCFMVMPIACCFVSTDRLARQSFISLIKTGTCAATISEAKRLLLISLSPSLKASTKCFVWHQKCRKDFRLCVWTSLT